MCAGIGFSFPFSPIPGLKITVSVAAHILFQIKYEMYKMHTFWLKRTVCHGLDKKLRYRREYSVSVVLSCFTVKKFLGREFIDSHCYTLQADTEERMIVYAQ